MTLKKTPKSVAPLVFAAVLIIATLSPAGFYKVSADSGILQPRLIHFPIAGSTVLSDGTVLVINIGDWTTDRIYKSIDQGMSWSYVSTLPDSFPISCEKLYCTDKDTVLAVDGGDGHQGYIYRSSDKGLTWTEPYKFSSTTEGCSFDFFEDNKGQIYVPVYSFDGTLNHAKLLRSTDDGVSWQQIANWQGYRHCHDVFVNSYNGYIYVAVGDVPCALMRSKDNGLTWTNLDTVHLWTSINSKGDSNTVYLGEDDTHSRIYRFTDDGTSSFNLQKLYDYGNSSAGGYWFLQNTNGKLVFGTSVDAAGKHALLGVSDAAWNSFSVVQDIVANGPWQGFWPATTSYWPLTKIYVAYTCDHGIGFQASSTTFALNITSTSGGTTSPSPGTHVYASEYQVQVTAIASSNYLLAYWELDGLNVGAANPYNITMNLNHTLNAVFKPATGVIYIQADGSIDPPTAPIHTADNTTYTLTGNITADADGIVIERGNIVLDGAGYTVRGSGSGNGTTLMSRSNVTVRNMTIRNFFYGIYLYSSSHNTLSGNNIANNGYAIWLSSSFDNSIFHNNFVSNSVQVLSENSSNTWDDGYPSVGNYWSDFTGVDVKKGPNQDEPGSDGIGDMPYAIDASNLDRYPLMYPYGSPPPPTYSLTITTTANGTIDPATGTYLYSQGQSVPVQAIPDKGYGFDHWEIDGVNRTENPINVIMDQDHTSHAVFMIHDVAVIDVTPSKTVVGQGYDMNINVALANQGDYTETFNVTVYADQNTTIIEDEYMIGVLLVTLADRNSTVFTFQWNATLMVLQVDGGIIMGPKGNYSISAYAWPVPGETETDDNNCTCIVSVHVGVPGDVSSATPGVYDGTTNMRDIAYMIKLLDTKPNSPNWNPNADINDDGIVNMGDIAIAIAHFNQHG
jgi:parallel beta-helix repeat protein